MQLEKREIVKCILLSIITCGIYAIIWAIKLARDAVKVKDVNDDGTLEILLTIFLSPIGFFLSEKKLNEGCQAYGIPHKDNSIIYLVLGFLGLGIVNFCLMQSDLNKIAESGITLGAAAYEAPAYSAPQEVPFQDVPRDDEAE